MRPHDRFAQLQRFSAVDRHRCNRLLVKSRPCVQGDLASVLLHAPLMRGERGFTLAELMTVVAIVAALSAIGYPLLSRARPRADLQASAGDLAALLHNARQNALTTGNYSVVMVFPDQPSNARGIGRVLVYEDSTFSFATASFAGWDATKYTAAGATTLIGSLELPRYVRFSFGTATIPSLAAPYGATTVADCNFCSSSPSGDRRGAIVFDSRGRARFYRGDGTLRSDISAATIAVSHPDLAGYRLVVVSAGAGLVRVEGT
jgi:prepilin-type N-terminal cleavage/methylation domain-containing protein